MELKRIKPYKARKPEETIFLIRKILHQKLGILLKEEHFIGDDRFYSCRISIANFNLEELNVGTNGKGMGIEYALASAYGEFMERLQNQMLIMSRLISHVYNNRTNANILSLVKDNSLLTKYSYAPDEQIVTFTKSMEYIKKYIKSADIEQLENVYDGKKLILVPFVNVMDKSIELLPLNIILSMCTSNGMCAGNTAKEAIIQGMSEILERFVIRKIYYDNISFPTIPFDNFGNSKILKLIEEIQAKYKCEFYIKDCSCGMGIPAIGVLVIDRKNMKYLFHIGVDPSPITALERTLTEIYQGRYELFLKEINVDLQNKLLCDVDLKSREMFKTCTVGNGQFPISLLFGEPTYSFEGFDLDWGQSDENDFVKMIELFNSFSSKVYIRDVSYLGFPAFHIYVPGMSEFRNITSNEDLVFVDMLKKVQPISRNLEKANVEEIKLLLEFVTKNSQLAYNNLKFCNTSDFWQKYNEDLVLSLLYYTISEYKNALKHMDLFISNANMSDKEYRFFTCLSAIIKSKAENLDIKWINATFGKNFVEVCNVFLMNKNYLKYLNHPNCYMCDSCRIKSSCKVEGILVLAKKMEDAYVANTPDQNKLLSVLCE